jgi:hypothetical protein
MCGDEIILDEASMDGPPSESFNENEDYNIE